MTCTFSLYQPNDHADGGLSVDAQVKMAPFMRITTSSEVYDRLWVVHEADIAIESNVKINGQFDLYCWSAEQFAHQHLHRYTICTVRE